MVEPMSAVEGVQQAILLQQTQDPQLPIQIALGGALIFYGLSLVAWGGFGAGWVEAQSAGIVSAVVGTLGVVWAVTIITFLPASHAATAAVVGAFGIAFLSAGFHTSFGIDLAGHGLLCLVLAGVVAIVAVTFTLAGATPYLTIALWSYVVVLIGFFGGAFYGTDRWLQVFTYTSFATGILTTGLYGALLITGHIGF